jgi:hypothetical protein
VQDAADAHYVFVHIPKVGGTSLRHFVMAVVGERSVSPPFVVAEAPSAAERFKTFAVLFGHISRRDVAEHCPDRVPMTLLRDPVDRILSWYRFLKQNHRPTLPLRKVTGANSAAEAITLAHHLSLEDFLQVDHPHVVQNIDNRIAWQLGDDASVDKRTLTLVEATAQAEAFLAAMPFVGHLETLAEDASRLRRVLGGELDSPVPLLNTTRHEELDFSSAVRRALDRLTEADRRLVDVSRSLPQ